MSENTDNPEERNYDSVTFLKAMRARASTLAARSHDMTEDDLVHEAFVRIAESYPELLGELSEEEHRRRLALSTQIMRNLAVDSHRRMSREATEASLEDDIHNALEDTSTAHFKSSPLEGCATTEEVLGTLRAIRSRLNRRDWSILVMRLQGQSYASIGLRLGMAARTARSRFHRLKRKIRASK